MISVFTNQPTKNCSIFESLNPHKQLIIGWDFVFVFNFIVEIDSGNPTVGIDLDPLTTDILGPKGFFAVLLQVEDNFVPPAVKLKRHGTLEGLDPGDGLIVGGDEGPLYVLIV